MLRGKQFAALVFASIVLGSWYGLWHWNRDWAYVNAAARGDIPAVRRYLDEGVRTDARGCAGMTAIKWAANHGDDALVRLLLKRGADPNSAMSQATLKGHPTVVVMLVHAGARIWGTSGELALCHAALSGDIASATLLLHHGVGINCKSSWDPDEGCTPLIIAAGAGSWPMFEFLVKRGADITVTTTEGKNALMFAAGSGMPDSPRICRFLINHGTDVNAKAGGQTALMSAVNCDSDASLAVLNLLLKSGADPMTHDLHGRMAVDYATDIEHPRSADRLFQAEFSLKVRGVSCKLSRD